MKDFYCSEAAQKINEMVTTFFVVAALEVKTKRNGEPYMALMLADRTGLIDAKLWDGVAAVSGAFQKDDFVKLRGRISTYNQRHEIVVERIRRAEEAEVEADDYMPRTDKNINELWVALLGFIYSIENEALRTVLQQMVSDDEVASLLRLAPAAKSMHHAYLGGLLDHMISLCGVADLVCHHYGWPNRDLVIAGAILHDIGKVYELSYSRSFGYTDRGEIVGHIAIGLQMLQDKLRQIPTVDDNLTMLLQHLLLSHHGTKENGSPVEPRCAEALILHVLDNLDAKMDAVRSALQSNSSNGWWTARVASVGQRWLDVGAMLETAA